MVDTVLAPASLSQSERLFTDHLLRVPLNAIPVIDMAAVDFIEPLDSMFLLLGARSLAKRTGQRVELINLQSAHLSYLDRIAFFEQGDWVYTRQRVKKWHKNRDSMKVMELARVTDHRSVSDTVARVRTIVGKWVLDEDLCDSTASVVAELCNNAREHSGQEGYVTVQCYQSRHFEGQVSLHIAVGDSGKGIPAALVEIGKSFSSDAECIKRVLKGGLSSKGPGKGGDGLRKVRAAARAGGEGSSLLVRSGRAVVASEAGIPRGRNGLPPVEGTQALVILQASA